MTFTSLLGFFIRFDKNDREFSTTNIKNNPQALVQNLKTDTYIEILDAYSLLYFAIIGVDFRNYIASFNRTHSIEKVGKIYDCSRLYFEFYQNLSKNFNEKEQTSPFVPVVLKNFIWASSEIIEKNLEKFLDIFTDIRDNFIPKFKTYLSGNCKFDYIILENPTLKRDLEMDLKVLLSEVNEVVQKRSVINKTIKYDEAVRG